MSIRNDISVNWGVSPRVITVDAPSTEVTIQDLYDTLMTIEAESAAMDDDHIIDCAGKESLGGGTSVGLTATLLNALLAFEARSGPTYTQCSVSGGNLVALEADLVTYYTTPIYPTAFTQVVTTASSSATSQNAEQLEYASFNGGVTYDEINGTAGTDYPIGTPQSPVNNITDAQTIALERGFTSGFIIGNLNVQVTDVIDGFDLYGDSASRSTIDIPDGATFQNCSLYTATVTGYLDGDNTLERCTVGNLFYIKGTMTHCTFNVGTITLGASGHAQMDHCHSGVPGDDTPNIAFGTGSLMTLAMRDYHGGIKFVDKDTDAKVSVDMSSGQVKVGATVSAGTLVLRGIGEVTEDLHTGTAIIDDELLNNTSISTAVWDHQINGIITGSMGEVQRQMAFGDHIHVNVADGLPGTTYPLGTHNHPVNNIADALIIGATEGHERILIEEDVVIQATDDVSGYTLIGAHANKSQITFVAGCVTDLTQIENSYIVGTLNGSVIIRDSVIDDITGFAGIMFQTMIGGSVMVANAPTPSYLLSCYTQNDTPIELDLSAIGSQCHIRDYHGGVKVVNKTGVESMTIGMAEGKIILDGTVTNGAFIVAGNALLLDSSSGTTIDDTALLNSVLALIQIDITNIENIATEIRKFDTNRVKIDENTYTLTVYEDDLVTPFKVYNLKDVNGLQAFQNVFERVPV